MNNKEFINYMVSTFPEIEDDVLDEDNDGLITLQLGYFMRYVQNALDKNDEKIIKKCFDFVEECAGHVEFKVENALYLSVLNKLDFKQNHRAMSFLSEKLVLAKSELAAYELSGQTNKKVNEFLTGLD
ncbi:DUF7674 family protein [Pedobacter sp. PWIIR3]